MQSCRPVLSLHRNVLFTFAAVATVADCKRHAARAVHAAKQLNLHPMWRITIDFLRALHGRMRTESVRRPDTCTTKIPAQKKTKPSSRPSASERRLRSPICRGGPAAYFLSVLELPDQSTALNMAYSDHAPLNLSCAAPICQGDLRAGRRNTLVDSRDGRLLSTAGSSNTRCAVTIERATTPIAIRCAVACCRMS